MIMVILITVVMLLIPVALATATVGQLPVVRHDQDSTAAFAAAEAGVDDYANRLNASSTYWQSSVPAAGQTRPAPTDGNLALLGWVKVSSLSTNQYCYTVDQKLNAYDTTLSSVQGIVLLTVYGYSGTGTRSPATVPTSNPNPCSGAVPAGGVERIISVQLRQIGFLDNLELTDLQLVDQTWANVEQGQNATACYNDPNATPPHYAYYWKNGASGCGSLQNYWGTGNVLDGPMRTNDDWYLCGTPNFKGPVVSDDPTGPGGNTGGRYWVDPAGSCGTDNPIFNGQPFHGTPPGSITANPKLILFPQTDTSQITYAKATGVSNGCYYVGPTNIQLTGTRMAVVSPMTNSSNSPNYAACVGTSVALPGNGVIYVASTTDDCKAVFGTNLDWALTGLPTTDVCKTTSSPGDVFIQGTLHGALSVVSDDNVFITGDLTYTDTSPASLDVLGIIASNYIEVVHPVDGSGHNVYGTEPFFGTTSINAPANWGTPQCNNNVNTPDCNVTVDAALLSLSHSLGIQKWGHGNPVGTLTIVGSIAQEYMDIEGTFSGGCSYKTQGVTTQLCTGYNSVYSYDPRLAHLSPPHFLNPAYAQWKRISFTECPLTGCLS